MKEYLEKTFASEEVIGVTYETWCDDPDDLVAMLPNNFDRMGNCTNCARYVVSKLGKGEVYGFYSEDNPAVTHEDIVGQGHDFAVIDNRYIVDLWISLFTCSEQQIVYDLTDKKDYLKILEIFGNPLCWKVLNKGRFEKPAGFLPWTLQRTLEKGKHAFYFDAIMSQSQGKLESVQLVKEVNDYRRWLIFLPDASIQGKFRYQEYDESGFYSHSTFDNYEAALRSAVKDNFFEIDNGSLSMLSKTQKWARGMKMVEKCQASWR